jgi:hypothetical protein
MSGQCVHMGQFSVTIYGATGSVLSDNQQHIQINYMLAQIVMHSESDTRS